MMETVVARAHVDRLPPHTPLHTLTDTLVVARMARDTIVPDIDVREWVTIDVHAIGINPADLLQARGFYDPPPGAGPVLGLECSGIVTGVGEDVVENPQWQWIHPGTPVCALLPAGAYAEQVVAHPSTLFPVPSGVSIAEAAGLAEAAVAATMVLRHAPARECHPLPAQSPSHSHRSILIHGASGGVGALAVQIAAQRGYRVFATAGTAQRCRRVENLGAEGCFDYHEDWANSVPEPVDLIVDVTGAAGLEANIRSLARGGTLAVLGLIKGRRATLDLGELIARNATITAETVRSQPLDMKARLCQVARNEVWPLLDAGVIRPVVEVLAAEGEDAPRSRWTERVAVAHRRMSERDRSTAPFGRLVVDCR